MTISWCAAIACAFGDMPNPGKPQLGGPLLHRVLLGVQAIASNLSWAGLAMSGVVVLSAVLLRR